MNNRGWIGVDLDGTLAKYEGWKGCDCIGDPVPSMVKRVKMWLDQGLDVRIFTARVGEQKSEEDRLKSICAIKNWCVRHLGRELIITCTKDYSMIELWDDRCVTVEANTGRVLTRTVKHKGASK